jgi:hypothetical protein
MQARNDDGFVEEAIPFIIFDNQAASKSIGSNM